MLFQVQDKSELLNNELTDIEKKLYIANRHFHGGSGLIHDGYNNRDFQINFNREFTKKKQIVSYYNYLRS